MTSDDAGLDSASKLTRRALELLNEGGDAADAKRLLERAVAMGQAQQPSPAVQNAIVRFSRAALICTVGRPYWGWRHRSQPHPVDAWSMRQSWTVGETESGDSVLARARDLIDSTALDTPGRDTAAAVFMLDVAQAAAPAFDGLHAVFLSSRYPQWGGTDPEAFEVLLRSRALDSELAERSTWRLLYLAARAGVPQRRIARLLHEPQSTVNRRLRQLEQEPHRIAVSPGEILDRHKSEQIDRSVMLALLAIYPYDHGHRPTDSEQWAYIPGSWDELARRSVEGDLEPAEFEFIVSSVEQRQPHDSITAS